MAQTDSSSPSEWHVLTNGQRHGPYSSSDLLAWIGRRAFGPEARFSRGDRWMTASEAVPIIRLALAGADGGDPVLIEVIDESPASQAPAGSDAPVASDSATHRPVQSPAPEPDAGAPRRDRIVVIGRRASGKTIYLATLYELLWKCRNGLTMRALSGRVHKELMDVCDTLRRGEWPAATLKATLAHMEIEVTYNGSTQILVGLDYAGEVFRDAFINDDAESPEAKALLSHIDRAAAVVLLIDPAVAVSGDADAFVDDDFGIVQAMRRIRDWPGGEKVPIALVLTKSDQNRGLFKQSSTKDFVAAHYPALLRTLGRCKCFHASAVQAKPDGEGRLRPAPDSVSVNVAEPLRYCLAMLQRNEVQEQIVAEGEARRRAAQEYVLAQEAARRRSERAVILFAIGLAVLGICIAGLILVFHM